MKLALYTTVYPQALPFFAPFYRSVEAQLGEPAELWIGLDGLTPADLENALEREPKATIVTAPAGATPATLRSDVLERIVSGYDGVVLVDSDDLLYPSRVEAARLGLERVGMIACALDLIEVDGAPLGRRFGVAPVGDWLALEAASNVFGFSNSAYRSQALAAALPLPADAVLIDWYVACLALAAGTEAHFDPAAHMAYRRHGSNTAGVVPPFSRAQLATGVELTLQHYRLLGGRELPASWREALGAAHRRVLAFERCLQRDGELADRYLRRIADHKSIYRWWEWIANDEMEETWRC